MWSRVLVALGLNPIAFPQCSRLPANLAGMEGLLFGGFDALADRVIRVIHVDNGYGARQTSLSLAGFQTCSRLPLEFLNQWFQVLAET